MPHTISHASHTEGLVIHWAARYDLLVRLITLGRARRLRERMADLLELRPGDAVLDVACGTGDLALALAERVGASGVVAGIDASPEMIARARKKAGRQGVTIDFRLEPAEALSFPDQSFDGVISSLAFHHLPGDLKQQALANIARVLKPGGQVCIIDALPSSGHRAAGRMADRLIEMSALSDLLRAAGFIQISSGQLKTPLLGMLSLGFVSARKAVD